MKLTLRTAVFGPSQEMTRGLGQLTLVYCRLVM